MADFPQADQHTDFRGGPNIDKKWDVIKEHWSTIEEIWTKKSEEDEPAYTALFEKCKEVAPEFTEALAGEVVNLGLVSGFLTNMDDDAKNKMF